MWSSMRDRLSKAVIGLLIATFFFCVPVLHRMGAATADLAPQVSLTVAVLLTVVTVPHIVDHDGEPTGRRRAARARRRCQPSARRVQSGHRPSAGPDRREERHDPQSAERTSRRIRPAPRS